MTAVIMLFVAAMILILAEFFLPGAILGVIGTLTLIASIAVGWMKFPEYGFLIFIVEMIATAVCIVLGIKLISKTRARRLMVLDHVQENTEGYSSPIERRAPVGTVAQVHNALRPAGSIMVGKERVDAVSDGTFIETGKSVRVIEVSGNRVVVEGLADEEAEA